MKHRGLLVALAIVGSMTATVSAAAANSVGSCADLFSTAAPAIGPLDSLITEITKGARITTQSLSDIDLARGAKMDLKTLDQVHDLADQITSVLRERRYHRDVRTVVYPAVGYDAGLAFRIFPNAETVIGLDYYPFAYPERARDVDSEFPEIRDFKTMSRWAFVGEVKKLRGLRESIVAAILRSAQDEQGREVRIRRIHEIDTPGLNWDRPVVHGIVEFDHGPETSVRRYIHLNIPKEVSRKHLPQWSRDLLNSEFDAILAKAAMHFFTDQTETYAGLLVKTLRRRGGVLIDADFNSSMTQPVWPMAKSATQPADVTVVNTSIQGLGYASTQIVKFSGKPSKSR